MSAVPLGLAAIRQDPRRSDSSIWKPASATPPGLWGEASYEVERVNGQRVREMEVEPENAEPGSRQVLSLDGFELGTMIVNLEGKPEFGVSEEDEQLFPVGFPEPKADSVFRVGNLMELRLDDEGDLTVDLESEGKLTFSTKNGPPFPAASPEPRAGSWIRVDGAFRGELLDVSAAATGGDR